MGRTVVPTQGPSQRSKEDVDGYVREGDSKVGIETGTPFRVGSGGEDSPSV